MDDQEIFLKDYFKIVIDKKGTVIITVLIFIIGALIFNYFSPKVYEVSTWLEIGKINGSPVEPAAQVISKIKEGIYGGYPGVTAVNPQDTSLVQIMVGSSDVPGAKDGLEKINKSILDSHSAMITAADDLAGKQAKSLEASGNPYLTQIVKTTFISTQPTKIVQPVNASKTSVSPRPLLDLVIAFVSGLLIGTLLIFVKKWWEEPNPKSF